MHKQSQPIKEEAMAAPATTGGELPLARVASAAETKEREVAAAGGASDPKPEEKGACGCGLVGEGMGVLFGGGWGAGCVWVFIRSIHPMDRAGYSWCMLTLPTHPLTTPTHTHTNDTPR